VTRHGDAVLARGGLGPSRQENHEKRVAGLSTSEAVRGASLDALRTLRARGGSTHPLLWGAFVAAGDWR
jgi:hypothetical protein